MPISVAMMLGSFAHIQGGTLAIMGAGWTVRDPDPIGSAAIGLVITVPREYSGKEINFRLDLLDDAGKRMLVTILPDDQGDAGEATAADQAMEEPSEIFVEGPVATVGLDDPSITIPLTITLAVNLPRFRLPPSKEFRWQLYLDGETQPDWALPFRTTPPEP
jgi:hypothetical protein